MQTEQRTLIAPRPARIETREDNRKVMVGYAAVFYSPADEERTQYKLWDGVFERIMPGAFDRALSEQHDVRAVKNHDQNLLLGRTKSGTARLSVDAVGLRYEIDLPDTGTGRDTEIEVNRGDLSGSSFKFAARKVEWSDDGVHEYRSIMDVDLFDVGPVTFPAYEGTSVGVRSRDAIQSEYDSWKQERRDRVTEVDVRLREIQLDSL